MNDLNRNSIFSVVLGLLGMLVLGETIELLLRPYGSLLAELLVVGLVVLAAIGNRADAISLVNFESLVAIPAIYHSNFACCGKCVSASNLSLSSGRLVALAAKVEARAR